MGRSGGGPAALPCRDTRLASNSCWDHWNKAAPGTAALPARSAGSREFRTPPPAPLHSGEARPGGAGVALAVRQSGPPGARPDGLHEQPWALAPGRAHNQGAGRCHQRTRGGSRRCLRPAPAALKASAMRSRSSRSRSNRCGGRRVGVGEGDERKPGLLPQCWLVVHMPRCGIAAPLHGMAHTESSKQGMAGRSSSSPNLRLQQPLAQARQPAARQQAVGKLVVELRAGGWRVGKVRVAGGDGSGSFFLRVTTRGVLPHATQGENSPSQPTKPPNKSE